MKTQKLTKTKKVFGAQKRKAFLANRKFFVPQKSLIYVGVLSIILLVLFIISFSVSITAFNKPLAKTLSEEKQTAQLIDFFKNKDSLPDVFNSEEKSHLIDVKNVLNFILSIALVSLLFLLILKLDYKTLIIAGIITILITLIIALLPWSLSFDLMHNAFFTDNWSFPADSKIISFFPESMFQSYAFIIFSIIFLLSIISIITGIVIKKYRFLKT